MSAISSVQNAAATYPLSAEPRVIASLPLELALGSIFMAFAEMGTTTPQPQVGGYNTLVGSRLVLADSAENSRGTLVVPGIGENVTPQQHHMLTSRAGAHVVTRTDRPYLNLVAWFNSTRAQPGDVISVDLARLTAVLL